MPKHSHDAPLTRTGAAAVRRPQSAASVGKTLANSQFWSKTRQAVRSGEQISIESFGEGSRSLPPFTIGAQLAGTRRLQDPGSVGPGPTQSRQASMADSSSGDGAGESREELNQRLHDAALAGDVVKLREAIAAGADVDARLPFKTSGGPRLDWTPLCCVVSAGKVKLNRREKGRTACIRALLDAGASASEAVVRYEHDERPAFAAMHDAAYSGFATICRLLLDAGEDLNVQTCGDFTPLRYAAIHKHHRLVVLLLSRGAATDDECTRALEEYSPGYLGRISSAGGFAKYQKQQCKKLTAMLAPKMSHLLPPELVSHVITFWGHLGWK